MNISPIQRYQCKIRLLIAYMLHHHLDLLEKLAEVDQSKEFAHLIELSGVLICSSSFLVFEKVDILLELLKDASLMLYDFVV